MPQSETDAGAAESGKGRGRKSAGDYSVRSLERALRVLECFDLEHPDWSLVELSRLTGLHKATAFRSVKTLESQAFLAFDPDTNRYHLGPALLRLSYVTQSHEELVRIAHPHLEELAAETGETVDLAVWSGNGVVLIDQVLTSRPFKPQGRVGRHFNDARNSHTRLFAALGPEEWLRKLVPDAGNGSGAGRAQAAGLGREALERIRKSGVAFDICEHTPGICAVSAPVLDAAGRIVASLSVVAPDDRFGPEERERHVAAAERTGFDISHGLGYEVD